LKNKDKFGISGYVESEKEKFLFAKDIPQEIRTV
jgi:hypothetical protein